MLLFLRLHMEVKILRLFGFVVNPHIKGEKRLKCLEEGDPSGKSPEKVSSEVKKSATGRCSGYELKQEKYECQFCSKEFKNPQALGGHQNAHRKERLKRRRMQLQETSKSFNFYLDAPYNQNNLVYHNSLSCFDAFSAYVPQFKLYQESLITFSPSHQSQNFSSSISNVSKIIPPDPKNSKEDISVRSTVLKPSPSYTLKGCQKSV